MTRYAREPSNPAHSASARGAHLRTSFKNTCNTAQAIRGWRLDKAFAYLEAVVEHKRAIPFRKYAGSTGRTAQAKEFGLTKARWPVKSVKFISDLLKNAKANADAKGLNTDNLVISHIQVNQAPNMRRRTFRAHGRINPYLSSPSHIEIHLTEDLPEVEKAKEDKPLHLSSRQRGRLLAQKRRA